MNSPGFSLANWPPKRATRWPLASSTLTRGPRFGVFSVTGMPEPSSPTKKSPLFARSTKSPHGRWRLFHWPW